MKSKLVVTLGKITFWILAILAILVFSPTTPTILLFIHTSTIFWIWLGIDIIVLIGILWFLITAVIPQKSDESNNQ
jgi:hypothetical protein